MVMLNPKSSSSMIYYRNCALSMEVELSNHNLLRNVVTNLIMYTTPQIKILTVFYYSRYLVNDAAH